MSPWPWGDTGGEEASSWKAVFRAATTPARKESAIRYGRQRGGRMISREGISISREDISVSREDISILREVSIYQEITRNEEESEVNAHAHPCTRRG